MFSKSIRECGNNEIEMIQAKLKAAAKLKLSMERQVYKLNNTERSLYEELHSLRAEIDLLTEQLEDLKDKISESSHQIVKRNIEKEAEKCKIEVCATDLENHRREYDIMFEDERKITDLRNRELAARDAEQQEMARQRQNELDQLMEKQESEAAAVEEEAAAIERECAVLKKRNNAIMLKLRRKLVQTEDARRELINQQLASKQT